MELIDIGANLTHDSFNTDRAEVISAAQAVGVSQMIVTGADLAGSAAAIQIAQSNPSVLYATAGVHPHHASEWSDAIANSIEQYAGESCVVAVGEAGLDFNRNYSSVADQERALHGQLSIAAKLGKPVFLHERDAFEAFAKIIEEYREDLPAAVVHCFTGQAEHLAAYLEMDLHIGITGWICDERRGHHLHDMVVSIPAGRLMIETDAPYLLPRDIRPKPKSRRNVPAYLPHIAEVIAAHREESVETLAKHTTATARDFFNINAA